MLPWSRRDLAVIALAWILFGLAMNQRWDHDSLAASLLNIAGC
jgi:hypothetical protein